MSYLASVPVAQHTTIRKKPGSRGVPDPSCWRQKRYFLITIEWWLKNNNRHSSNQPITKTHTGHIPSKNKNDVFHKKYSFISVSKCTREE